MSEPVFMSQIWSRPGVLGASWKMPQVVAVMIAGASLYAGMKWVSKVLGQAQEALRHAEEEARRERARAAVVTKDLGALELDPETGVYRPRSPRTS